MYVVMEEQIKMDSFIEENQGIQEEQFWWMNIDSEAWNIAGGKIGETQAIHSLDIQSWIIDKGKNKNKAKNTILWLLRYFKDDPDNPHFGLPIAPQEMAISLLDSENGTINKDEIEKAKKRISEYLKSCLNRMGIVKDPDVVLNSPTYRRQGGRRSCAWLTVLDQHGKPVMGVVKNKYRHEVSSGERIRELSADSIFVHYFYRNRPGGIPTNSYTPKHEYDEGYVQAAPKEDPEVNYDIKSVSPYPDFRTGDTVFAYNVMNNRIIGLLKVLGTKEDMVTLQIEQIYDNPVFIVDFVGMKHLTQIRVPFKLTLNEFKTIRKGVISNNPQYASNNSREYSKEDLQKSTFISVKLLDDIDKTLEEKKCIILQGAPGVGKTFLAERIAFARMKEKNYHRIEFVQFHPNYTYEDFIIGYKPRIRNSKNEDDEKETGKSVRKSEGGFVLKDGVFKAFCHEASIDSTHDYYFIIDEINRGNISKIFGEAFSLIEKGYRGKSIKLAYSQKKFFIPDNVYIVGLMNTADRSLAMIDFALRRRFAFFTLEPAFETDAFKNYLKNINSPLLDKIIQAMVKLNEEIKRDSSLGPGFCIGHSYFCFKNKEEVNDERLKRIIRYEIIPMLQEYWFDNDGKFKEQEKKLREIIEDDER